MSYAYAQRKKADAKTPAAQNTSPERMDALARGAVKPTAAEMGHRVDLPEAMRAKMESSFGADLSAVRLYESQTVADAGAEAIAQGGNIAFAPGKLDLSGESGQALLGHELSHVVSQARGEVTGGGFLNDHALEARADREGAMAARGESVYGGAAAPLSTASAAPAAGPMQAKRNKDKDAARAKADMDMMHRSSTEEAAEQYEDEVRESGMGDTIEKIMLIFSMQDSRDKHEQAGEGPGKGGASDEDVAWYNDMMGDKKSNAVNIVSAMQKMYTAKRLRAHAAWEKLGGHNAKEEDVVKLAFGDDATDASTYEDFMRRYIGVIGDDQLEDQVTDSLKKIHSGFSDETKKKLDEYNDFTQTAWNSKLSLVKKKKVTSDHEDPYEATPLRKKLEAAQEKRHQKLYDKKYDKKWYEFWK